MTQITAEMVKKLRDITSVAMMECKKALVAANGDETQAIEILRKAGQATAVKKGSRIAADGLVAVNVAADHKTAVIVEVNCETDFVAREACFKEFVQQVAVSALSSKNTVVEQFATEKLSTGATVEEARLGLVAQLGENVSVRRISLVKAEGAGVLAAYAHGGGDAGLARIAAVVALNVANVELAKDLAMHVAAMKPEYLSENEVPAERVAKEKEILLAQAQENNAGKPVDILEKIISGKINKFIKEITLLGQSFVKDPDQTVGALLAANKAMVTNYLRFEVGEGIEKKVSDFVNEVMSQAKA